MLVRHIETFLTVLRLQIGIKGALAPTGSSDATLSALALTDADNNAITLDPTFASGLRTYTAEVGSGVTQIKVEPTKNEANATIEYLDSTDSVLSDADVGTPNVFDVDIAEGETVFKVKVTAEDTTFVKTYTVTVTRVDFLVSNLGQTSRSTPIAISGSLRRVATQFTTGGNIPGYKISEVRIPISIDSASLTILVSIYSDVSGEPGSSVKPLTHPASITVSSTETTEVDFDAGDQKLEANTPYWIVVDKLTGTGDSESRRLATTPKIPVLHPAGASATSARHAASLGHMKTF